MKAEKLKSYFLDYKKIVCPTIEAEQRQAAVLILLVPGDNGTELIFTRRSEGLSSHAGQISFPGGTIDANDKSPIQTALRESEEEIGLNRANVEVLGTLEWHSIPSGFLVLPVIGCLNQEQVFKPEPNEVAEIFTIPLHLLLDTSIYKQDTYNRNGINIKFYFLEFKEYYIWGATAGMLRSLAIKLSN